jgi:transcriptional regulatory protein RtcR
MSTQGNFRDLNASIVRMATFAAGGRITREIADGEIGRLQRLWRPVPSVDPQELLHRHLPPDVLAQLDPFDAPQLHTVIQTCIASPSLSEAGRRLFAVSRTQKQSPNDADRLRKYLARFRLEFRTLRG